MVANYLFVVIGFLLDGALASMFPVQFATGSMYFVPCIGFCAMILNIRKMNMTDSLIMSISCGLFYDSFYANTTFLYVIIFIVLSLLVHIWKKQINYSMLENATLCISTIFIRELIVYLYMTVSNPGTISLNNWLVNRMFLTLLVNAGLIILLVFISYVKEDYLQQKEVRIRKEERIPWMRRK